MRQIEIKQKHFKHKPYSKVGMKQPEDGKEKEKGRKELHRRLWII
jgi:hypothetical protein